MNRVLRPLICLVLPAALLAALPGLAMAGDHGRGRPAQAPTPRNAQQDPSRQDPSALPDSVRRVERTTGGEVLRAEPMQRDGREVYRMKVLTADGRIRVVQEDPRKNSGKNKDKSKDKDASPPADSQDPDQSPPQE